MSFEHGVRYTVEIVPPPFVGGFYITGENEGAVLNAQPRNRSVGVQSLIADQEWTFHKVEGKADVYTVYGQPGGHGHPGLGWSVNHDESLATYTKEVRQWVIRPIGNPEENTFKIRLHYDGVDIQTRWLDIDHSSTDRQIILEKLVWAPQATVEGEVQTASVGGVWKFTKVEDGKVE